MLGIFSRIRRQLFLTNKVRRYVLYSIGEVLFSVLGILIANWLAKSEERNKQQIQEIRILNGIKESLAQDTLTLKPILKSIPL